MFSLLFSHPLLFTFLAQIAILVTLAYVFFVVPHRLAVWNLQGPPFESFIAGNQKRFADEVKGEAFESLSSLYGSTFRFGDLFGKTRVASSDPSFVNHILKHSYDYPKEDRTRSLLTLIMPGCGILTAEGDVHKRQRRGLAPAFSAQSIRELNGLFLEQAYILRNRLVEEISRARKAKTGGFVQEGGMGGGFLPSLETLQEHQEEAEGQGASLDVRVWLSRATLDIIGLAGFDYNFGALRDDDSELSNALAVSFHAIDKMSPWLLLQIVFPILQLLPSPSGRALNLSRDTFRRVGEEMVKKKKKAAVEAARSEGDAEIGKDLIAGRNLLSQMVRANMASDLPDAMKLSDDEVASQIGTFILAGFETSSTAMTWMLYALSENPSAQAKLREELLRVRDVLPSSDSLNTLPYLEAVVRETLRLYAPVSGTVRVATKTDVVPLSEPILGRNGEMMSEVVLEKGVSILIPILPMNRSKLVWGEDAFEFRPERWLDGSIPAGSKAFETPYANLMTFLGGTRSCIGMRFALAEIKALTFVLVSSLTFKPLDVSPKLEYVAHGQIVSSPRIKGRESEGEKMLLEVAVWSGSEGEGEF